MGLQRVGHNLATEQKQWASPQKPSWPPESGTVGKCSPSNTPDPGGTRITACSGGRGPHRVRRWTPGVHPCWAARGRGGGECSEGHGRAELSSTGRAGVAGALATPTEAWCPGCSVPPDLWAAAALGRQEAREERGERGLNWRVPGETGEHVGLCKWEGCSVCWGIPVKR